MTDFPDVTILICTYNRYDLIKRTMTALSEKLIYPREHLRVVVADDSSPGAYLSRLKRLSLFRDFNTEFVTTPVNSGWGANVNNGLRACTTPYVFFIEDDYELMKDLDLRVGVALLETKTHLGMVRYRGTAGMHYVFHQFEASVGDYLPGWREAYGLPEKLTYLHIDGNNPSLYIYSHGAHLKRHPQFHDFYGYYPEGLRLGETEETYAHTVRDKIRTFPNSAPGIVILPEWLPMQFDHIGTSYQHTELDD